VGIHAVVFDFGNVVCMPQDPKVAETLGLLAGVNGESLFSTMNGIRPRWDEGRITGEELYRLSLESLGSPIPSREVLASLVKTDMESWARLNPETLAMAAELSREGLRLGILSNMPHEFLSMARSRFPLFSEVELGIFSCELGVNKPDPEIYHRLLEGFSLPAHEVLFFDDIAVNVAAAAELGIVAHLWTGPSEARAVLKEQGLLR